MAEITDLADYPLTGARARHHDEIAINAGGMLMDRILVAFCLSKEGGFERVNQKKIPQLAQFEVEVHEDAPAPHFLIHHEGRSERAQFWDDESYGLISGPDAWVDEFGDATPVILLGAASRWLSHEVDTGITVQLGQKPLDWQRGVGRDMSAAKVAPLHVVTMQSVEYAKSLVSREKVSDEEIEAIEEDRLRANIVIDAPEQDPLSELTLTELRIGNLTLVKTKDTVRCNIPGLSQQTGEKMRDLPFAYKRLPQSVKGRAVLGAYFYTLLEQDEEVTVSRGDKVDFSFD